MSEQNIENALGEKPRSSSNKVNED